MTLGAKRNPPPNKFRKAQLKHLPGAELVIPGLREAREGEPTECGLLVLIAAPRLRRLGFDIPDRPDIAWPYEHQLYALLERTHGPAAYSRYCSLIRRIVSFSSALEQIRSRELAATPAAADSGPREAGQ